jgi:hypothetical protein
MSWKWLCSKQLGERSRLCEQLDQGRRGKGRQEDIIVSHPCELMIHIVMLPAYRLLLFISTSKGLKRLPHVIGSATIALLFLPWTLLRLYGRRPRSFVMLWILDNHAFILAIVVASAGLCLRFFSRQRFSWSPCPPGPKGSYILGCTAEMLDPSVKPWDRFRTWSKQYGADKGLLSVPTLARTNIIIKCVYMRLLFATIADSYHNIALREQLTSFFRKGRIYTWIVR